MKSKGKARRLYFTGLEFIQLCVIIIPWIGGTVLAPGGMKWLAFFFCPYAWYLVVEKIMKINGWI